MKSRELQDCYNRSYLRVDEFRNDQNEFEGSGGKWEFRRFRVTNVYPMIPLKSY